MTGSVGAMCFDDYGRPFVIVKEQEDQSRLTGIEALKSHILAAKGVANMLRTSLGPKGMDKLLVSPDGDVVITNDGATILELMDVEHEVAKLMVDIARSQDKEVGDGTTGVVVLAGALLERSQELLDKNIHPIRIADGYEVAAKCAAEYLEKISFPISWSVEDPGWLMQAIATALSSKVASKCLKHLGEVAIEALKCTCDLDSVNPEVELNSILLRGKSGGQIEHTELIRGVLIERDFAHPQMKKSFERVNVAVFSSSALQLPKVNTKHELSVGTSLCYAELGSYIDDWCCRALKVIVHAGAELVVYSGKIEERLVHLFLQQGISAVESVPDVHLVATTVSARVLPKVEEITREKLGRADKVRLLDAGTTKDKLIAVEQLGQAKIVTIFVRGSNEVVVAEVKRSLQDALYVLRNLIRDNKAVWGGGAAEICCSLALQEESLKIPGLEQLAFQAFADALDAIPTTLAENSGLFPLQVLTELRARCEPCMGVDCMLTGDCDMSHQGVVEGLAAKKQQLVLATQLVKMVLKIDDVRGPNDEIKK